MRAYKTVNDAYIEPISFTVPRRAETFQADIFPPATGTKPAASAKEWFDGKTAIPAKIDLESVYEARRPKRFRRTTSRPLSLHRRLRPSWNRRGRSLRRRSPSQRLLCAALLQA